MKTLTNFLFFIIHSHYRAYEWTVLIKLADNKPSGCRWVLRVNSAKQGFFEGIFAQLSELYLARLEITFGKISLELGPDSLICR